MISLVPCYRRAGKVTKLRVIAFRDRTREGVRETKHSLVIDISLSSDVLTGKRLPVYKIHAHVHVCARVRACVRVCVRVILVYQCLLFADVSVLTWVMIFVRP